MRTSKLQNLLSLRSLLFCTPIFLLLPLSGCKERVEEAPRRSVTVAQFGDFFLYAPLYIAIDAGFFERQGLDVKLVNTGGDETTWATVVGGRASFGVADPTFVAIAGQRGRPGVVVASLVESVPFWGISFSPEIKAMRGRPLGELLSGRTVATFPAPSTAYTLQGDLAQQLGVEVSIREAAPGTLIPLLRAKEADMALELEPNVSLAVADGAEVLYSLAERYPEFIITGVTTTPEILRDDPRLVESFVCGIQQAFDFIRVDSDSAIALLSKRFPIPGTVAASALQRVVAEGVIPEVATIRSTGWEAATKLRIEAGDLSGPAPFEQYVNNNSANRATVSCRISHD
jgi:NitT/TauT family transport system substrate-binding protein